MPHELLWAGLAKLAADLTEQGPAPPDVPPPEIGVPFDVMASALGDFFKGAAKAEEPVRETRRPWSVTRQRTGRRPISVARMLDKEKDGSLGGYKLAFAMGPGTGLAQAKDLGRVVGQGVKRVGNAGLAALEKHENPIEVAGLAYLAAPNVDNMQAKARARMAGAGDGDGHVSEHDMDKYRLIKEKHHDLVEATGLGSLAAPLVARRLRTCAWGHLGKRL